MKTIEIDGKQYQRLFFNSCCRCDLRPEVTGKPCPIEDCNDGFYYRAVKVKENQTQQPED